MSTMKVLCTTTSYRPAIGGAQIYAHHLFKHLSDQHKIQVVTHWSKNRTDWLLGTTLNAPKKPEHYEFEGIPVDLITLTQTERLQVLPFVFGYYGIKPIAIQQIAAKLMPKIAPFTQQCDLIHNLRIGREPMSFASFNLARKLDIPFVFVPYHHPRWVGWNYREYISLYKQADAISALTNTEKETLISLGVAENRIFVTGIGPVLADQSHPNKFRKQLNLDDETPLILFLGQKYRYKGIEALRASAEIVWQKHPNACFLFIGPRTPFSEKFFESQSDRRVIELGAVDLQQKSDALAACNLLCLPSTQESFGGVFTEAWSFKKPVIGGNIPAIRDVLDNEENGYLVDQTAEDIAEKIAYLLQNRAIGDQLGEAGYQKVLAQYTWDRLAQKTEEIYTTVLRGN